MINSTDSLTSFIDNLHMADIYVEDNFPLPLQSTFKMQSSRAVKFLLGSALVGNKVAGFFHKLPPFEASVPLRAACVFISSELPSEITIPLFFCKTPDQLAEIMPKAVKTSADTSMPVHVVISANTLNNYSSKEIPYDAQDRVLPYLSASPEPWQPEQKEEKLKAAYEHLTQLIPQQASNKISLKATDAWFPEYIMPVERIAQSTLMKGITSVSTTPAELPFIYAWLHNFLGLDTKVTADLEEDSPLAKTELCPGCPFAAIYANDEIVNYTVFTSVICPAVKRLYNPSFASYPEYLGMVSKKINTQTLFISMASQMADIKPDNFKNGTVIILQDLPDKPVLPLINTINKFKQIKNSTLPYGCTNIKKSSAVKLTAKKCKCLKQGTAPKCKENTHCPAIYEQGDIVGINKLLCSGCKLCAGHCPTKALS